MHTNATFRGPMIDLTPPTFPIILINDWATNWNQKESKSHDLEVLWRRNQPLKWKGLADNKGFGTDWISQSFPMRSGSLTDIGTTNRQCSFYLRRRNKGKNSLAMAGAEEDTDEVAVRRWSYDEVPGRTLMRPYNVRENMAGTVSQRLFFLHPNAQTAMLPHFNLLS